MCYYFGQVNLWSDVHPTPRQRHLVAKYDTTSPLVQVDLQSDVPPRQRHFVARCDTISPLGQVDLWSDVPLARDILWPSVILLQIRLTCLFESKFGASSHHNSSSISIY